MLETSGRISLVNRTEKDEASNMFSECIYGSYMVNSATIGGALTQSLIVVPKLLHSCVCFCFSCLETRSCPAFLGF